MSCLPKCIELVAMLIHQFEKFLAIVHATTGTSTDKLSGGIAPVMNAAEYVRQHGSPNKTQYTALSDMKAVLSAFDPMRRIVI